MVPKRSSITNPYDGFKKLRKLTSLKDLRMHELDEEFAKQEKILHKILRKARGKSKPDS